MKKQALILMLMGAFTLPSSLWAMQECEDIPVVYCGRFSCSPNVTAELALPPASGQIALAAVIGHWISSIWSPAKAPDENTPEEYVSPPAAPIVDVCLSRQERAASLKNIRKQLEKLDTLVRSTAHGSDTDRSNILFYIQIDLEYIDNKLKYSQITKRALEQLRKRTTTFTTTCKGWIEEHQECLAAGFNEVVHTASYKNCTQYGDNSSKDILERHIYKYIKAVKDKENYSDLLEHFGQCLSSRTSAFYTCLTGIINAFNETSLKQQCDSWLSWLSWQVD